MIAEALSRLLPVRATRGPTDDFWFQPAGAQTSTGVTVTPDTALTAAVVFACVRLLSEAIGSLPCMVYRRDGDDKTRAQDHPLYDVLHRRPNR